MLVADQVDGYAPIEAPSWDDTRNPCMIDSLYSVRQALSEDKVVKSVEVLESVLRLKCLHFGLLHIVTAS